MSRQELVDAAAAATSLPKNQADAVLKAILTSLGDALGAGREVRLAGFGSFAISERAARQGRNPATGEVVQIAASKSVKFKPAKDLKERLG
ncbi:HU family DNA-binding protein [Pseudoroseomonas oryzae]|uniref:HU family DNA-binding protein n=2 Tax=Teichococcus oryzae TaxID=1608942 RepID=A0A5B2TF06_9PROT|nr:HU family DNA-binding protein [Pseudoroseomonas oryzae]